MTDTVRGGPLVGLRVVEFASIGPGPHAVIRGDRCTWSSASSRRCGNASDRGEAK
jgi:hypothetical protein